MIIFQKFISREDLRRNRDVLYVFGDNFEREGLGGQAKEMRGEPNAVGLVTKRDPGYRVSSFLTNADLRDVQDSSASYISWLEEHLQEGGLVVWPLDGIGTGRARLSETAPEILQYYDNVLSELQSL